jgi:hypothetical protein
MHKILTFGALAFLGFVSTSSRRHTSISHPILVAARATDFEKCIALSISAAGRCAFPERAEFSADGRLSASLIWTGYRSGQARMTSHLRAGNAHLNPLARPGGSLPCFLRSSSRSPTRTRSTLDCEDRAHDASSCGRPFNAPLFVVADNPLVVKAWHEVARTTVSYLQ